MNNDEKILIYITLVIVALGIYFGYFYDETGPSSWFSNFISSIKTFFSTTPNGDSLTGDGTSAGYGASFTAGSPL
jgi:hypothetical protein